MAPALELGGERVRAPSCSPAALAGGAATLGVAALGAAARGRRWHGEDLQAGADLAEIAAKRTTPLDGLRAGVQGVRSRLAGGAVADRPGPHRGSRAPVAVGGLSERVWRRGEASARGVAVS